MDNSALWYVRGNQWFCDVVANEAYSLPRSASFPSSWTLSAGDRQAHGVIESLVFLALSRLLHLSAVSTPNPKNQ